MALLGIYVGVIPVSLGMLWLPFVRRVGAEWLRVLIAFTVGLLAFLAVDAGLEGLEIAGDAPSAFGGTSLVFLGALIAYLVLAGIDVWLRRRREARGRGGLDGRLHGAAGRDRDRPPQPRRGARDRLRLRDRRARARHLPGRRLRDPQHDRGPRDRRADGAARPTRRPPARCSGLIAGAPAILGAWIGAAAFNPSVAALLFGVGVGAIAQVIVQLAPSMRDDDGRLLHPGAVGGLLGGRRRALPDRAAGGGLRWRTPASGAIPAAANSEAVEDYAKAIYALSQRGEGAVTTSALAERLGVSPGSVTAMLKRMVRDGPGRSRALPGRRA